MYNRDKIINLLKEIRETSSVLEPYVVIAQPRRVEGEVAAQNFQMNYAVNSDKEKDSSFVHIDLHGFTHGFCNIYGEKVDVARNYLIEQALSTNAKYMLFVGEDTVLPYNAFKKLHQTAEANPGNVVVGVYYIKISDAMIMCRKDNHIYIPNVDPGQVLEAWQTGMDAMLIPMDVLRKLKNDDPDLPFCCIANEIDGEPIFIGEDNFFVHRLHKAGIKLLVDTDVQCLHMDLATGKYTAHPSIDLDNYYTNIPITDRLTIKDKRFIDKRWIDRLPEGTGQKQSISKKIDAMIENGDQIKFNMGCGRDVIEGYIGVDSVNDAADIKADIVELKLPSNCADEILASHVIEHVPHHLAIGVLSSWYETLKPNGKLILELPNIEEMCKDFVNSNDDNEKYLHTMCIYGAASDENGNLSPHVWGYYPKILKQILQNIGYVDIQILPQVGIHPGKNFRVEASK